MTMNFIAGTPAQVAEHYRAMSHHRRRPYRGDFGGAVDEQRVRR